MKAIEKMPMLDYFEILNTKHERALRQKEASDRAKRERLSKKR